VGSILLVRHGHAVAERARLDDGARWLSRDGRAQAARVAELVRDKQIELQRLFASPLVRAVQTAELFAQTFGFAEPVECLPELSFSKPAQRATELLRELGKDHDIAAFGHMPTIAATLEQLTSSADRREFGLCEAVYVKDARVLWSVAPH
jgi:phosphohistidine phosphatase